MSSKSIERRFGVVVLLQVVLQIGFTTSSVDEETLNDYRVPLKHPLLSAAADPESELSFYFTKLNIGYPKDDLDSVRKTPRHKVWTEKLRDLKVLARNFDACELLHKTQMNGTRFNYDEVTEFGFDSCYNQCLSENWEYYQQFLAEKLDDRMRAHFAYYFDFRFSVPESYDGQEKMSECERSAKYKYRCRCFYKNFLIKVCPHFERLFGKILFEVRDAKIENPEREELVKKHGVPKTVLGFLIIYHLRPDDLFNYLLWWTNDERRFHSSEEF